MTHSVLECVILNVLRDVILVVKVAVVDHVKEVATDALVVVLAVAEGLALRVTAVAVEVVVLAVEAVLHNVPLPEPQEEEAQLVKVAEMLVRWIVAADDAQEYVITGALGVALLVAEVVAVVVILDVKGVAPALVVETVAEVVQENNVMPGLKNIKKKRSKILYEI